MKKKSDIIMLVLIMAVVFGGFFLMKNKRLDGESTPTFQITR